MVSKLTQRKIIFVCWGIVAVALGVFMSSPQLTPDQVGVGGILVFFGLLYIFLALSLYVLSLLFLKVSNSQKYQHPSLSHMFLWALIPLLLLALSSLQQLTSRDVLIIIIFTIVIVFYLSKKTS